jgi:hypothetical protein
VGLGFVGAALRRIDLLELLLTLGWPAGKPRSERNRYYLVRHLPTRGNLNSRVPGLQVTGLDVRDLSMVLSIFGPLMLCRLLALMGIWPTSLIEF